VGTAIKQLPLTKRRALRESGVGVFTQPIRPLTLHKRLLLAFFGIILLVAISSAFVGVGYINRSLPRIQDVLAVDLGAAADIYREYQGNIGDLIRTLAQRQSFREILQSEDRESLTTSLQAFRQSQDLDLLVLYGVDRQVLFPAVRQMPLDGSGLPAVVRTAIQQRKEVVATLVLSHDELASQRRELAERARIDIVSTPHSPAIVDRAVSDGLILLAAVPVIDENGELLGVLCGGQLVNRRNSMVDRIRNNLYRQERFEGRDVAVVSIFLDDKRIATSASTPSGDRALGTLISAEAYDRVITKGQRWIKSGYVVDDWYLTAYQPIRDFRGNIVGALGLGLLERKFEETPRRALLFLFVLTVIAVLAASFISYGLSNSILKPVDTLVAATRNLNIDRSPQRIELEGAPPEIEALGTAFNEMTAALHERDRELHRQTHAKLMRSDRLAMIGQLAAGVAHEINNPLGSILLFSRLVMQQVPPEGRARENLERIEKETNRCHTIVKGLLDFAREQRPLVQAVDVNRLLDATLKLFQGQFLFQNIEIVKNYEPQIGSIEADPSQLQQVFMNIILNAADAMNGKGRIIVATRTAGTSIEISISDTGCGIPANNLDRIFDPFFTTKEVGHGTGLGLSVSYGIIQAHNGDISVASKPGAGAAFTISLPKSKGARP
jgi:two-component system, NtrC family, sensor kinase